MNILVRSATLSKYSGIARGLGIDPVRMVHQVGLDRQYLLTPDLRLPESSWTEVLECSAKASDCSTLGLLVGESWRLSDFGVISLLLQHQPSLRQALSEFKRYRHLLSDSVMIDITEYPNVCVLQLVLISGRTHPGRQRMELAIGALLSLCRFQLGAQWMPRRVHFCHAAPSGGVQAHQRVFGTALEFGSEFDGIVLGKDDLDRVNPACDPEYGALCTTLHRSATQTPGAEHCTRCAALHPCVVATGPQPHRSGQSELGVEHSHAATSTRTKR